MHIPTKTIGEYLVLYLKSDSNELMKYLFDESYIKDQICNVFADDDKGK